MTDSVNSEQRKKKLWQERKARKKLARMSSECRRNIDASVFKLRDTRVPSTAVKVEDTKEPTATAKDRPNSKEPAPTAEECGTRKRRSDGDNSTDRPRKKKRRRLINRAERDKLLASFPVGEQKLKQKLKKKAPRASPLLREVCI